MILHDTGILSKELEKLKRWYIKNTRDCLFEKVSHPLSVRGAQECAELSLKAVLRSSGIEYPREHVVSKALDNEVTKKLPNWFFAKIQKFMGCQRI